MKHFPPSPLIDPVTDRQHLSKVLFNIGYGTLGQNDNIRGLMSAGTTPGVANTEFSIVHNLGYIPVGFHIFKIDTAAHIYASTTAWTNTTIYLKCDQVTVEYTIFIL